MIFSTTALIRLLLRALQLLVDAARGLLALRIGDEVHGRFPPIRRAAYVSVHRGAGSRLKLGGSLRIGYQDLGEGVRLEGRRTQLLLSPRALLSTNGNVTIGTGSLVWIAPDAEVHIGNKSYTNIDCRLLITRSLKIGDGCAIGWNVSISDNDFHPMSRDPLAELKPTEGVPITIEDGVWIGANATILKGVTIGRGAIVAAGALVRENVPPATLVAGNPARVIQQNIRWLL